MKRLDNVNLIKLIGLRTSRTIYTGINPKMLCHVTGIALNNANTIMYHRQELEFKDIVKNLNKDYVYFFVSNNILKDKITLIKVSKGKNDIGNISGRTSFKKIIMDTDYIYVVKDMNLKNVYKNGRNNNYNLKINYYSNTPKIKLYSRLQNFKMNKLFNQHSDTLNYVLDKVKLAYEELSINFMYPTAEFNNKLPVDYKESVLNFDMVLSQRINHLKNKLKYRNKSNDYEYKEALFDLYSFVKKF